MHLVSPFLLEQATQRFRDCGDKALHKRVVISTRAEINPVVSLQRYGASGNLSISEAINFQILFAVLKSLFIDL